MLENKYREKTRNLIIFFKALINSFNICNNPVESYITAQYTLKKYLTKEKTYLFIACFPKSASTYITNLLANITGYQYEIFISSFQRNEHDLYEPKLIDAYNKNTVTHQHMRATPRNISLLKKFHIKPIILVRNIFDCVVSLREHFLYENYLWPMAHINRDFFVLDKENQYNFIIDHIIPWYIDFYVSWNDYSKEENHDILWLTYEGFSSNQNQKLYEILAYYQIDEKHTFSNKTIENFTNKNLINHTKTRFNKGITGRGKRELNNHQQEKIKTLTRHYKSTDFSIIGID